ncbi:Lrp/AsnC family transcriptional regulator [Clostridium sp. Mt-5]|uniref:Lrp/AsnC family transcriptional regulator n=1 Tax=Clostridium moutaii TaxID=3240932 RepID=A0ABV4BMP3_9CLOT
MDEIDKRLLELIQNEIPIDKRPFKILGKKLLITEEEVLQRIDKLKEKGFIRRIGGIFDSRKLGYTSTYASYDASNQISGSEFWRNDMTPIS